MTKFRLTIDSYKIPEGFIPVAYRPPLPGEYILTPELEALRFPEGSSQCFIILKEVLYEVGKKHPAKVHCTIDIPLKQKGFNNHVYQLVDLRVPKVGDIVVLSDYTLYTLDDTVELSSIYPIFKHRVKEIIS